MGINGRADDEKSIDRDLRLFSERSIIPHFRGRGGTSTEQEKFFIFKFDILILL